MSYISSSSIKALLIAIMFFNTSMTYGQLTQDNKESSDVEFVCSYKVTFRPDSTSATELTEKMQLSIAGQFSEFRSANRFSRDSMKNSLLAKYNNVPISSSDASREISALLKSPQPKFTYVIYKYKNNKCTVHDDIVEEHYQYDEPDFPLQWKIEATKSIISGYNCQKATTTFAGRNYTAWFTREIAISDGPYKFSGLPGLIIKVSDATNSYNFQLTELSKPVKRLVLTPPVYDAMKTTKSTFLRAAHASRVTAIDRAAQFGVTIKNPEAARMSVRENNKRANNSLELKY